MIANLLSLAGLLSTIVKGLMKAVPALIGAITRYQARRRAKKLEDHIREGQDIERRIEEAKTNEERANLAEELARHISGRS